jgi:hypothetical protein
MLWNINAWKWILNVMKLHAFMWKMFGLIVIFGYECMVKNT